MTSLWVKTGRGGWVHADQIIAIEPQNTDVTIASLGFVGTMTVTSCKTPEAAGSVAKSLVAKLIRSTTSSGLVVAIGENVVVEPVFEDTDDESRDDAESVALIDEPQQLLGKAFFKALSKRANSTIRGWKQNENAFHEAVLEEAKTLNKEADYARDSSQIEEVAAKIARSTWHFRKLQPWVSRNVERYTDYEMFLRDVVEAGRRLKAAEGHTLNFEEVSDVAADAARWVWKNQR